MKILFAASENAWGGFLNRVKALLPDDEFVALGRFEIPDLNGFDILIPTMSRVTHRILDTADRLKLIQQGGCQAPETVWGKVDGDQTIRSSSRKSGT